MSDPAVFTGRARVRAGILVTGTEVLTGIITDRNGPWLSERLAAMGVDVAMIEIVGDRPADLLAALQQMGSRRLSLIVTSGGLGPTADDLTAEMVGLFSGREMVLDAALEGRIAKIVENAVRRWPDADRDVLRAANRKQAVIPEGATVLEPRGTAPGLVVEPASGCEGPTVVVLPGPPGELRPMWEDAVATPAFRHAIAGAPALRREMIRLFGMPEAEIASTLRAADAAGVDISRLEITTCLRRGELEVSTRFDPTRGREYEELLDFIAQRHGAHLFSRDGSTIDQQVAEMLLAGQETIAVAESCTGGLLAARLTDSPGSSAYVLGGAVVYGNRAKTELAGVRAELIDKHGAVSEEVALALAAGARARFHASLGVGITGVAGPGGGSAEKPVGLVWLSVARAPEGAPTHPPSHPPSHAPTRTLTRSHELPGDRASVRDRATTVAMHMIAEVLHGGGEPPLP